MKEPPSVSSPQIALPRAAAPRIRTLPRGIVFQPAPGETVLDAALRAGLPLASSCGGRAVCGDCVVRVVAGGGTLHPPDADETAWRARKQCAGPLRLACCLRPTTDCVIATTYW